LPEKIFSPIFSLGGAPSLPVSYAYGHESFDRIDSIRTNRAYIGLTVTCVTASWQLVYFDLHLGTCSVAGALLSSRHCRALTRSEIVRPLRTRSLRKGLVVIAGM